jgi:hypothetical protein
MKPIRYLAYNQVHLLVAVLLLYFFFLLLPFFGEYVCRTLHLLQITIELILPLALHTGQINVLLKMAVRVKTYCLFIYSIRTAAV